MDGCTSETVVPLDAFPRAGGQQASYTHAKSHESSLDTPPVVVQFLIPCFRLFLALARLHTGLGPAAVRRRQVGEGKNRSCGACRLPE